MLFSENKFSLSEQDLHSHMSFSRSQEVKANPHIIQKPPEEQERDNKQRTNPGPQAGGAAAHPLPRIQMINSSLPRSARVIQGIWSRAELSHVAQALSPASLPSHKPRSQTDKEQLKDIYGTEKQKAHLQGENQDCWNKRERKSWVKGEQQDWNPEEKNLCVTPNPTSRELQGKPFSSEQFSTNLLPISCLPDAFAFHAIKHLCLDSFPGIGKSRAGQDTWDPRLLFPTHTFTVWERVFPWKLAQNLIATAFFPF